MSAQRSNFVHLSVPSRNLMREVRDFGDKEHMAGFLQDRFEVGERHPFGAWFVDEIQDV